MEDTKRTTTPGQLWRQYIIAGIANISMTIVGYCMGWTSPVNGILNDEHLSPLPEPVTLDQGAWIGSLISVGLIIGPFLGGYTIFAIGRKWGLLSTCFLFFVGCILILLANSVAFIYAGRIFWGLASGMAFVILPIYCAEISTVEVRGTLGSFLQTFITLGFLLVYSIGPFTTYAGIAYVSASLVTIFFVAFLFMPETPTYYFINNDRKSAAEALAQIRGQSIESLQKELDLIKAAVDASRENTGTVADIFRRKNLKAFLISCALMFFQQFSGITVVMFYMTDVFTSAGSNLEPAYATIIVGVVQFLASLVTPIIAYRYGRRTILMFSCGGCTIGLLFLGLYFFLADIGSPIIDNINILPLISMMVYIVMFRWGLGALSWTIMGEMMPIEVKATATPVATAFCWACSFLATRYYSAVAEAAGHFVVFWIFAACSASGFVFGLLILPETKGKTFNEIQDMLAGRTRHKSELGL